MCVATDRCCNGWRAPISNSHTHTISRLNTSINETILKQKAVYTLLCSRAHSFVRVYTRTQHVHTHARPNIPFGDFSILMSSSFTQVYSVRVCLHDVRHEYAQHDVLVPLRAIRYIEIAEWIQRLIRLLYLLNNANWFSPNNWLLTSVVW